MSGPPSQGGDLRPAVRAIAVRGGAVDPDGFCAQALRALHAELSDEPRFVFEAYLAHLRACGAHLDVLVEAAEDLPAATRTWLARWGESPSSPLRRVGTGESDENRARDRSARREPGHAATPPEARSVALAPAAHAPSRIDWSIGAAALLAFLAPGLLLSLPGGEREQPRAVVETAVVGTAPSREALRAGKPGGADGSALRPDAPGASAPAPQPDAATLSEAIHALEDGDAEAYKRAIRRISGPEAADVESELVRWLDEPERADRVRRMLAAWGLALVGGRDALPALELAASDADPHVAALASRSAAVIRARLAAGASDRPRP